MREIAEPIHPTKLRAELPNGTAHRNRAEPISNDTAPEFRSVPPWFRRWFRCKLLISESSAAGSALPLSARAVAASTSSGRPSPSRARRIESPLVRSFLRGTHIRTPHSHSSPGGTLPSRAACTQWGQQQWRDR